MKIYELKEGDEVYVSGSLRETGSIAKVEKVTKCFIIVRGSKFRKNDGERAGEYQGFQHPSIEPLTDELRTKVRHRVISVYLNSFGFQDLPLNVLEEIYKLVKQTHKRVKL